MSTIQSKNATVLGVSADTVDSHKRFVEKERLNFSLLADTEKKMISDYGVLAPNGFASRVTFVVGPDGRIRTIDRAVNAQFDRGGTTLTSRHGSNLALLLSPWRAEVGQAVPNFSVAGAGGRTISLLAPTKKATVVLFLSTRAPQSLAYDFRIHDLAADTAYKDVAFIALYSNRDEKAPVVQPEAVPDHATTAVARDTENVLADHFGVTVTPSVWVVDAKGTAVYSGAVDDNINPARVGARYLKDALDAILAGKPAPVAKTKPVGASVRRVPAVKRK